jgi:hypothetical protein
LGAKLSSAIRGDLAHRGLTVAFIDKVREAARERRSNNEHRSEYFSWWMIHIQVVEAALAYPHKYASKAFVAVQALGVLQQAQVVGRARKTRWH